jgi:hypothetical protein
MGAIDVMVTWWHAVGSAPLFGVVYPSSDNTGISEKEPSLSKVTTIAPLPTGQAAG